MTPPAARTALGVGMGVGSVAGVSIALHSLGDKKGTVWGQGARRVTPLKRFQRIWQWLRNHWTPGSISTSAPPTPEERQQAAGYLQDMLRDSATYYRYTITLGGGIVALSVTNVDKFPPEATPWLLAAWGFIVVSMIAGLLHLEALPQIRNRTLGNFRRGVFDGRPTWQESVESNLHR